MNKPDELVSGSLHALRLALASGPRMIRAVTLRNSLRRLDELHQSGSTLPEGLLLLAGALMTAFAANIFESAADGPDAALRQTAGLATRLGAGSLATWIALAAPALLALWVSLGLSTPLLKLAFGRGAPAAGRLMLATISAVAVLGGGLLSIAMFGTAVSMSLNDESDGAVDLTLGAIAMLGFAAPLLLPFSGFRYAQQASAHLQGPRRWFDVAVLGPAMFVVIGALPVAGYVFAQHWAATGSKWLHAGRASAEDSAIEGHRPQCYAVGDRVHCQVLLLSSAAHPLALTPVRRATFRFKDGKGKNGPPLRFGAELQQIAPTPGSSTLWRVEPNVPTPVIVSVPKEQFCIHLAEQGTADAGLDKLQDFDMSLLTGPGYALTTSGNFAYPSMVLSASSEHRAREGIYQNSASRALSDPCPAQ